jgi:hypothetical protein
VVLNVQSASWIPARISSLRCIDMSHPGPERAASEAQIQAHHHDSLTAPLPRPPRARTGPTHSHCTSHSLSPLNGSGILPCFRSSTCTDVGNDAQVVHSSLTSDQVGEDTWEKDQWELMGVLLGMMWARAAGLVCRREDESRVKLGAGGLELSE